MGKHPTGIAISTAPIVRPCRAARGPGSGAVALAAAGAVACAGAALFALAAGSTVAALLLAMSAAALGAMAALLRRSHRAAADGAQLGAAIDSLSDGFMLFDADDRLILSNTRMRDLYAVMADAFRVGATYEEILRAGVFDHGLYDTGYGSPEAFFRQRLRLHREASGEPLVQRIGTGHWMLSREYRTPAGGVICVRTDITELKRRELEATALSGQLEEKNRLLDGALASMSHGLAMFDDAQRLIICNDRYLELFSRPAHMGAPGTTLRDIVDFDGRRQGLDRAGIEDMVERRLTVARSRTEQSYKQPFPDGRVIHVFHRPMADGGSIAVYEDVTAAEAAERALREATAQAEMANRAKSEFLANMSHELRTPLNAVIGFSEILRHELFGPIGNARYRDYARDIHESGSHLLDVIGDILDVAKVEAGKQELEESRVDLDRVIENVLRLIRQRAHDADVALSYRPRHGGAELYADERMVKQILLNLLSNAVKFTPPGGAVAVCTTVAEDGLDLAVADSGIGIAEVDIETALSPFGQVGNPMVRQRVGTGLGLPLSKSLAELHGARLEIHSRVDHGTTVTVRFPRSRVISAAAAGVA